jgi:hypothetical protein
LNGVPRYMRTQVSIDAIEGSGFNGTGPLVHKAGGGAIDGPGPKGVDSVRAILAPGEHVLTAPEVDRMGGQAAVSAFRSDLMGEVQAYAKGGPVKKKGATNAIDRQKDIATAATKAADKAQKQVAAQKKKATAAQKAADKAQKTYEGIDGTKANRAAKKVAKDAAAKAKKAADAAAKKVDDLRTVRDDDRQKAQDANVRGRQDAPQGPGGLRLRGAAQR